MHHHFRGSGQLEEGEYYDPIIFLDADGYQKELIRRGPFGGLAMHKNGVPIHRKGIFECNAEGKVVSTKRIWVRDNIVDGKEEDYLAGIENKIKEGRERCFHSGEEKLGESKEFSLKDLASSYNEYGTDEMEIVTPYSGDRKESKSKEVEANNGSKSLILSTGGSTKDIHSILKETMAGSMREVIKHELQAWLGLRYQDREEAKETKIATEAMQRTEEEKEEGEMGGGIFSMAQLHRLEKELKRTKA